MKQVAIGGVLAAVAVFLWGFAFWATPLSYNAFNHTSPETESQVAAALRSAGLADGAWQIPDPMAGGDAADMARRYADGPIVSMHIRNAGVPMMNPMVMLNGWLHMLVTFSLLALLVHGLRNRLPTWRDRFRLVAFIGVIAAIYANLGNPVWFYQSWTHHGLIALYDLVSYLIAGAVIAWAVRPDASAA